MDWKEAEYNNEIYNLALDKGFSEIISKLLAIRTNSKNDLIEYLNPKIKNLMPDPFSIKDMDKGANFLLSAIKAKRKIAIFGDYDVDGACSSALLARFLRALEIDYKIYIPDRIMEGYGPNINALMSLKNEGYDLVITVDCGTTAFEALEQASENGLDILVVDHHLSETKIPEAIAVINPNRFDDKSQLGFLCGAGVSFMLLVAVVKLIKLDSESDDLFSKLPDLLELLDIVALATVCDVVPLVKLNRAIVRFGLKLMTNSRNVGLKELLSLVNIDVTNAIKSFHLGFQLGPRINAGGRVGKSTVAAELLATENNKLVGKLALELDHYNSERKAIEKIVLDNALSQIEQNLLSDNNVIVVANENWHPGVIGIVASRIKDKYQKPAAVISLENKIGKASARSVEGVNLGQMIFDAKANDLLIAGGGHAMAAGFTIDESKISKFSNFLQNIEKESNICSNYDLEIKLKDVNLNLVEELNILEPFGKDNNEPVFLIKDLMVSQHFFMQEKHLKLIIVDKNLGLLGNKIEAIIWNFDQFDIWDDILNDKFDAICRIKENLWNGKVQIRLDIEKFFVN